MNGKPSRLSSNVLATMVLAVLPGAAVAAPPAAQDVDVYSALCKIGWETSGSLSLSVELGAISRRILAGQGKLSEGRLKDEFPGIRNEQNRLLALQSYQDCMFRYIERFHPPAQPAAAGVAAGTNASVVSPGIPAERRREIVYLASELESFKGRMNAVFGSLPEDYYDKRDSSQKHPKADARWLGLSDYRRYRAFESPGGGLNFVDITNNDIALLCSSYADEVQQYTSFLVDYYPLKLPQYNMSSETRRVCEAARRGR